MAFSTYEAFVVVDPVTGRPVRAAAGKVTNPDTGAAVDLFDMNDVPINIITTNAQGYCTGFKTDSFYRSVLVTFGGVTLRKVALEVTLAAEAAAASADASADTAAQIAGNLTDRIEGVEALAGLSPSSPADGQTANLIEQPDTLTRGAVDEVIDEAGLRVFGTGVASSDTANLQAAMNSAATFDVPLLPRGTFTVNASLEAPTGLHADFSKATVTQTAVRTPIIRVTNKTDIRISKLTASGVTSDFVNSESVYGAAAIRLAGTTTRVTIVDSSLLGFAGAGIYMESTVSDVTVARNRITGAGATYITSTSINYSGGIVVQTGVKRWSAQGNEISGFAQGIVTGDNMTDVRVTGNYIHDIPGQHGLYLETMNGGVIANNLIRNTGLTGMKVQIGATIVNDADSITITGNVFINAGAQGILLTNPVGGTVKLRRISVTGNVIRDVTGRGIEAGACDGLHIADNQIHNVWIGIRIVDCDNFQVLDNHVQQTTLEGIYLSGVTNFIVAGNVVRNPASDQGASTQFGMQVLGTNANGEIRSNHISDSAANMRYGIYVSAGTLATISIIDNTAIGASDYGYRGVSTAARAFRGNHFEGALGAILTPPTGFTVISPPTADTASLKTAVDAVIAVLQSNGLSR